MLNSARCACFIVGFGLEVSFLISPDIVLRFELH